MQPTRDHAASPDLIEFGDSVKRLRMNASMSQRQFGAYVGLDQSSALRTSQAAVRP